MPRCGCASSCTCQIQKRAGSSSALTLSGNGSPGSPYEIGLDLAFGGGGGGGTDQVVYAQRDGGLDGNPGVNDTVNFDAFMKALHADEASGLTYTVVFEDGFYDLDAGRVAPSNVGFRSHNRWGAVLRNRATEPLTLIAPRGHFRSFEGMVFDGQRENIPLPTPNTMDRFVNVQLTPPPSNSTATYMTGGMKLTSGVAMGGKELHFTLPYAVHPDATGEADAWFWRMPIVPGAWMALTEGSSYEWVKVHKDYVYGETIVPLEGELTKSFTTNANVLLASTGNRLVDCQFLGCGVLMSGAHGNLIYGCDFANQIDGAAGHFDRGNRYCTYAANHVETDSSWFYFEDDWSGINAPGTLPPNEYNAVLANVVNVERGGPDYGTAVGAGNVEAIAIAGGFRTRIEDNVLDLTKASGANFRGGITIWPGSKHAQVKRNTVLGGSQVNSVGIRILTLGAIDPNADPTISDNDIDGFRVGIDIGQATSSRVTDNKVRGVLNQGIAQTYVRNATGGDNAVALHTIDGNDLEGPGTGTSYGIYLNSGSTVPAGSGYRGHNTCRKFSTNKVTVANYVHNPGSQDA